MLRVSLAGEQRVEPEWLPVACRPVADASQVTGIGNPPVVEVTAPVNLPAERLA